MNRPTTLLLIAVALAGYGVYAASFVPALLIGFALQAACALWAAFSAARLSTLLPASINRGG